MSTEPTDVGRAHRAECWCNGTGWRVDLGVPCNLPQLSNNEAAYLTSPTPHAAPQEES